MPGEGNGGTGGVPLVHTQSDSCQSVFRLSAHFLPAHTALAHRPGSRDDLRPKCLAYREILYPTGDARVLGLF